MRIYTHTCTWQAFDLDIDIPEYPDELTKMVPEWLELVCIHAQFVCACMCVYTCGVYVCVCVFVYVDVA